MTLLLLIVVSLLGTCTPAWADWPHQPAGSRVVAETQFNSRCDGGFVCDWGSGAIVQDATAPVSPPNVLQHTWAGHRFSDIANPNVSLPAGTRTLYVGFWWKPSGPPFYGWSNNQQKITLDKITTDAGRNLYLLMNGAQGGSSFALGLQLAFSVSNSHLGSSNGDAVGPRNLFPNVGNGSVTLGQWHFVEKCFETSTANDAKNGKTYLWLNGNPVIRHDNVNYGAREFFLAKVADQVWDAVDTSALGAGKTDWHRYDAARVAVGGTCGTGGGGGTPIPPIEPPSVAIASLVADGSGADVTLIGTAGKLRYWDDFAVGRPELVDYTPGSLIYRLVNHWKLGTTFLCVEPQTDEGIWTGDQRCTRITPVPVIVPPVEPPPPPVTVLQALRAFVATCLKPNSGCVTVGKVLDAELKKIAP